MDVAYQNNQIQIDPKIGPFLIHFVIRRYLLEWIMEDKLIKNHKGSRGNLENPIDH